MSYATPADLMLRFDANLLGMLVNDNSQQLTPVQINSDAATLAAAALSTDTWVDPSEVVNLRSISLAYKTGHKRPMRMTHRSRLINFNFDSCFKPKPKYPL